ncbi:MAG TPA: YdcF family protein [Bryobacteraceae bacterium]|nr:YdcF family protein [Bryobacteraceae bacterium]
MKALIGRWMFPPGGPLALLILALILWKWKRRLSLFLAIVSAAALAFACLPLTAGALAATLENQYRELPLDRVPAAQAIVVPSGYLYPPSGARMNAHISAAFDRLQIGADLLRAGKAPLLVLTGRSDGGVCDGCEPEPYLARDIVEKCGISPGEILVEGRATTTYENAVFTKQLLSGRGINKILLVTSAMHMPRAAAAFRKAGFVVTAVPVDFQTGWGFKLADKLMPSAEALTTTDAALHEWIGLAAYRITGKI